MSTILKAIERHRLEHSDRRDRTDVLRLQSKRVELDLPKLEAAGLLTPGTEKAHLIEEYRRIKLPLLRNAFGRDGVKVACGNLIMVTSSLPGEGKTTNALNLAMSMSMELDTTVLLVDGDLRVSQLSRTLGLGGNLGLSDKLATPGTLLSDVMVSTNVPKLSVLPAGKQTAQSTELLASQDMRALTRELSQRYPNRVILFDAPPLLVSSEARVLASLMGQIVMVVEAQKTPQKAVSEALSQLEDCDVVGLVMNKSPSRASAGYYGGYYGDAQK